MERRVRSFLLVFIVFYCSSFRVHGTKYFSLVWNEENGAFSVRKGYANEYVSVVRFTNAINETGWSYLDIKTNENVDDVTQAYAAGLAEGLATGDLIALHWKNTYEGYCTMPLSPYCQRLQDFLDQNAAWMQDQIDSLADTNPYWHQVRLFLVQFQGLMDGYQFQPMRRLPKRIAFKPNITGLLLMQIAGDLEDLESALQMEGKKPLLAAGSCSALIKLLPGNRDLYTSQDTWNGYNSMLRMLKKYSFGFHLTPGSSEFVPGRDMTFSSYPGILMSGDDLYVISTGLVSLETTIGNGNASRWKYITPEASILEGIRNMVANRLAKSGQQWTDVFSLFNSGTYNNQWMIVDYNKFNGTMGTVSPGLLYVLEQIPGMIVARDVTDVLLKQTYWPSYNTAYFPEIFNASGGPDKVAKYGDWFSYEHTPRANIFRRDNVKVTDLESMTRLMRYNDYMHDPLSACNCTPPYSAENAISARCDLNPANGTYPFETLGHRSHGGTDMKLTSSGMISSLQFIAISGPTFDNLPPFQWSKTDFGSTVSHFGHPDLWQFKPVLHRWDD